MVKKFVLSLRSILNILKGNNLALYDNLNALKNSTKSSIVRILGNGESLNSAMDSFEEEDDVEYMVVNKHVLSDHYSVLKPRYYVLADPYFFVKDEGIAILRMIHEKSKWPMFLLVPFSKRNRVAVRKIFDDNESIKVCFYNSIPFEGFNRIKFFLFNHNLSMPRPQNVVVASVYCAICAQFRRVELYGVEHSWLKYLSVNDECEVCLEDSHFYDSVKPKKQTWNSTHHGDTKLHEILRAFAFMFEAYWELQVFALRKGVDVVNFTIESYIDAFRKEINN